LESAKKKKSNPSLISSTPSQPKSKVSLPAAPSAWASGAIQSSSGQTSLKLSPALLVDEMQGTISGLAAAVKESGATDPVAKLRQEAVHIVSQRDDNLSRIEKITIIKLFRMDYPSVQTYLALLDHNKLRRQWLQKQLDRE
jgi:hypothetical protein